MKNSFVLYDEYFEHIDLMTDEQAGMLLRAIMAYRNGKDLPEMDAAATIAFSFIRQQMDRDSEKYEETCRKRAEAGAMGGRPRKEEKANGFSEKAKKANGYSEKANESKQKANESKQNHNEDEDDNEDEFIKRESVGKRKPERHKYGMYQNVLLSDEQMEKLQAEIPDYSTYIEEVSEYVAKTGKGYKDYLAAIRSWHRKDQQQGKTRAAPNRFNNFEQRDYDYQQLERQLKGIPV